MSVKKIIKTDAKNVIKDLMDLNSDFECMDSFNVIFDDEIECSICHSPNREDDLECWKCKTKLK